MAEESTKNKKIIVGLSGGIDSSVAAYLLKKQGFQCIGVSIDFTSELISDNVEMFLQNFHIENLNNIKIICETLEIPFYAVEAGDQFENEIIEGLITARLSGDKYPLRTMVNTLIVDILHSKAKVLEAQYIATGHYARLFEDQALHCYAIKRANDLSQDQSNYLSRVDNKIWSSIKCPLAELRKCDVKKIHKNLGLKSKKEMPPVHVYDYSPFLTELIESRIAESLRKEGEFADIEDDAYAGDHGGVHRFYIGQNKIQSMFQFQNIDPEREVVKINSEKKQVFLGKREDFPCTLCSIHSFIGPIFAAKISGHYSFAKINGEEELIPVKIEFKTGNLVKIIFQQNVYGVVCGDVICLYTIDKKSAQIIGSGIIGFIGQNEIIDRTQGWTSDDENFELKLKDLYF